MLKVLSNILCDLGPKVKAIGQKAGICDGVLSTSALVLIEFMIFFIENVNSLKRWHSTTSTEKNPLSRIASKYSAIFR